MLLETTNAATQNYRPYYKNLQIIYILHEATDGTTLNYRQNYMHMHYALSQTK